MSHHMPNGILEEDEMSKTEIIEVSGAWKKPSMEIPLQEDPISGQ